MKNPQIHPTATVFPHAVVLGDVTLMEESSIWFGAVARAELDSLTVGRRSNVLDNCVIHVDASHPCRIGDDVTVDVDLRALADELAQSGIFGSVREDIDRQIHLFAARVHIFSRLGELFEREIFGSLAHSEAASRKIHRVRAEANRRAELFKVARRCKHLGENKFLFHFI